ncbi:hypothetical protein B0O80DRAFT_458002 [Mortierella sp. GBAus27b]|nr:hypothetical protein B0O80DRAFT_458002 [Mortierella sp. GBAus27b]
MCNASGYELSTDALSYPCDACQVFTGQSWCRFPGALLRSIVNSRVISTGNSTAESLNAFLSSCSLSSRYWSQRYSPGTEE